MTNFSKQGSNRNRCQLYPLRVLAEPEGGEQLIKLIPQPIDGALTGPQQAQLGFRSNAETQQLVRALDDLKWLPEIVSRYRNTDSKSEGLCGVALAVMLQVMGRFANRAVPKAPLLSVALTNPSVPRMARSSSGSA